MNSLVSNINHYNSLYNYSHATKMNTTIFLVNKNEQFYEQFSITGYSSQLSVQFLPCHFIFF